MAVFSSLFDKRAIRVFISSTFQDMQDERSELIRKTFPRLREAAFLRDVTLTEVDLRWGITKEECESGKVMEICLREVKNSIPFFIGIIGNRYGWIPGQKDISEIVRERFPRVPGYVERQLSATEIEMQFGVLDSEEYMNAFFFIKEDERDDVDDPERLANLKRAVRENKKYPVSTYTTPEDLADQVLVAFTKLLNDLFPVGELSALEKERLEQRAVLNNLSRVYIKTESNFAVIDAWMEDWEKHQLVITGASGLGKSALVANWVKEKLLVSEDLPYRIIYHFVGYGGNIGSDGHVVKALCDEIRDRYGFKAEESEPMTDEKALDDLFSRVAAEGDKPLLIVLDGLNQIIDVNHAKRLNWLPIPSGKVKILFTTLEDDETMRVFKDRHYPVYRLEYLTRDERIAMVRKYLQDTYSKRLREDGDHPTQLERIVDDPQNVNTLVLKTLLDEVANFGSYETLDEKIEEYLKPDSISDFYQVVLQNYEVDFGEELVQHFLSLIAVSRNGLYEEEILEITDTKDKPLLWSQFYCSFRQHLIVKNGLIDYSHNYIREAVEERYVMGKEEWVKTCRERIVSYLGHYSEGKKTHRSMDEVPYQLDKLGDMERLHDYLLDFDVFSYLYRNEELNLGCYWRKLLDLPCYSLDDYFVKVDTLDEGKCASLLLDLGSFSRTTVVSPALSIRFIKKVCRYVKDDKSLALVNANLSLSYGLSNDYRRALEAGETALKLYRKVFGENHLNVANTYNNIGDIYRELSNYHEALKNVQRALEIKRNFYPENHPRIAALYNNLSAIYSGLENYQKALELSEKALETFCSSLGKNNPDVAQLFNNIGVIYLGIGEYQKALHFSQEALSIRQKLFGNHHPDVAQSLNNVGSVFDRLGRQKKALEYMERALAIQQATFGDYHASVATSLSNICMVYYSLGDYRGALDYEEKALSIYLDIYGENNLDVAGAYTIMGLIYRSLGEHQLVLQCLQKGFDIRRSILGEKHIDIAKSYNDLGVTYEEIGDHEKALEFGEKALKLFESIYGENHLSVAQSYANIGFAYASLGNKEQALSYYLAALELYRQLSGENCDEVARLYNNSGALYGDLDNKEKELEFRLKALEISRIIRRDDYIATILNRIATVYKAIGKLEPAREFFRQAAEKYHELGDEKKARANLYEIDNC